MNLKKKIKTVLITGATSGIGLETVFCLKNIGMNVVATGRDVTTLEQISKKYNIETMVLDISDLNQIQMQVKAIIHKYTRIDCLINCAGIGLFGEINSLKDEEIIECINTNFTGTILLEKYISMYMVEQKSGHIITVESLAADNGIIHGEIYSATKSGIAMFNRILEKKLRNSGIRITSIKPGMVNTKLVRNISNNNEDLKGIEVGEIANAIIFAMQQPDDCNISEIKVRPFDIIGQTQFQNIINERYGI